MNKSEIRERKLRKAKSIISRCRAADVPVARWVTKILKSKKDNQ